jgi:NADPH-dependent ferric siderophore reductase
MTSTEPTNPPDVRGSGMEASALLARMPDVSLLDLEVLGRTMLSPHLLELHFGSPQLAAFAAAPGQDLMLAIPGPTANFRRRYTIRRHDPVACTLDVDIVLHGEGPGARWAQNASPGDHVECLGPRGKIFLDEDATSHVFLGDESAIPATFAMVEGLSAGRQALCILEVADAAEDLSFEAPAGVTLDLRWVHRDGAEPGGSELLLAALDAAPLADGPRHAYANAELRVVAALRKALVAAGFDADDIDTKPYWRKGVANAAHGEPPRERDV